MQVKNRWGYLYHKYKTYVKSMNSSVESEEEKPKYYEQIKEIFENEKIVYNPNEVVSDLTEFQSSSSTVPSSSDVHFNFPSAASNEEDLVNIKNEYPMKTKMNDYNTSIWRPIQPKP